MRECLFCGSRADSLEHVIPQWVYRRIYPGTSGDFPVAVGRYLEGEGYVDKRTHLSLAFKARLVCRRCNNGWLSELESKASRTLDPLVQTKFPRLAREFLNLLRADAALLARWLSKTALTTSFALPGSMRLPTDFGRIALQGSVPAGCWLDLAKARVADAGAALTKTFPTINGGRFAGVQTRKDGDCFQFVLQINHLLLRVGRATGAYVRYQGGLIPFRLYPNAAREISDSLEYEDLSHFVRSVVLETLKNCPGEIPVRAPLGANGDTQPTADR